MIKDLRSVYSSILKCHSKRYISVVFVAFFDALMVFLSLNSIFETEKQKIYSGSPIAAIKVNAVLEGLTTSNVMMLMLGGLSCTFIVSTTVRFAIAPRHDEIKLLRLIGFSRMKIFLMLCAEVFIVTFAGFLLGTVAGILLIPAKLRCDKALGAAPDFVAYGLTAKAILITFAVILATALFAVFSGFKAVVPKSLISESKKKNTKKYSIRRLFATIILLILTVVLAVSISKETDAERAIKIMFCLIPLPVFLLSFNLAFIMEFFGNLGTKLAQSRGNFKGLIAFSNIISQTKSGISTIAPFLYVLAFVLPFGIFGATGKLMIQAQSTQSIAAQTEIALENPLRNISDDGDISAGGEAGNVSGNVNSCETFAQNDEVPFFSINEIYYPNAPYSSYAPFGAATCLSSLNKVMDFEVLEGDLSLVRGTSVATATASKKIGSKITVADKDDNVHELTIVAKVKPQGVLTQNFIMDFDTGDSLVSQASSARIYSNRSVAEEQTAWGEGAKVSATAEEKEIDTSSVVRSQRGFMTMICAVPLVIACVSNVVGMYAFAYASRNSRLALKRMGISRRQMVSAAVFELAAESFIAAVLLVFPAGIFLSAANGAAGKQGISAVGDMLVGSIAVGLFIVFLWGSRLAVEKGEVK